MGINCTKLPKVRPQQVESRATTAVDSVSRRASVADKMDGNILNFC